MVQRRRTLETRASAARGQALLEQRFDAGEALGHADLQLGEPVGHADFQAGYAIGERVDAVSVSVHAGADDADRGDEYGSDHRDRPGWRLGDSRGGCADRPRDGLGQLGSAPAASRSWVVFWTSLVAMVGFYQL